MQSGKILVGEAAKEKRVSRKAIDRLLDLKDAATYLGLSYWTVRDLVLAGILPSVKIPCPRSGDGRTIRRILVDRYDLDTFIEQSKEIKCCLGCLWRKLGVPRKNWFRDEIFVQHGNPVRSAISEEDRAQ